MLMARSVVAVLVVVVVLGCVLVVVACAGDGCVLVVAVPRACTSRGWAVMLVLVVLVLVAVLVARFSRNCPVLGLLVPADGSPRNLTVQACSSRHNFLVSAAVLVLVRACASHDNFVVCLLATTSVRASSRW